MFKLFIVILSFSYAYASLFISYKTLLDALTCKFLMWFEILGKGSNLLLIPPITVPAEATSFSTWLYSQGLLWLVLYSMLEFHLTLSVFCRFIMSNINSQYEFGICFLNFLVPIVVDWNLKIGGCFVVTNHL